MLEIVAGIAIALILLFLLARLLTLPLRLLWKLITNSIAGALLLWVLNLFGLGLTINFVTALIVGVFGIPGVLAVALYSYI